ncbi:hypothetical protein [Sphingomonas asaccharolytica]|uniref:hypothetical protein n=1 Tax=Sphingomonas asaccharolytica TaxID=40681 RepID=UPI0008343425|nr:hypothetical protein [Sphingomonas asaccharolytica]
MRTLGNLAIAASVAGGLFTALTLTEASADGLDLGMTKFVLPMVLGSGLFAGLNARSANRRVPLANDDRKAELLAFTPRPGIGWVVVMRTKKNAGGALGFDVSIDGKVIAQLMPKRFTVVALTAGEYRLVADMPGAPGSVVPLDMLVGPGTIQIFAIETSMGLMRANIRLDPVADTPAARAALARMSLVEAEA